MRVKMFAASSVALIALAAISSSAAAIQADRYSGFECEGYEWPADLSYGQSFICPVLNWFPGGLADVNKVLVQMTLPDPPSAYACGGAPAAKACVIYAGHNSGTYGSGCSLASSTFTRTVAGANAVEISGSFLDTWHSGYPLGAGYLSISMGGLDHVGCSPGIPTLRGYTVESD